MLECTRKRNVVIMIHNEFGAALASLTFNVFQFLRTVIGIAQLNAFVAWCKDAQECLRALLEEDKGPSDKKFWILLQLKLFVHWYRRKIERLFRYARDNTKNSQGMEQSWVEENIKVNNTVVDDELGRRQVTVLPSWKKVWNGLMKGAVTPSRWLQTDRVMLNTVRWSSAYSCAMGEHWNVGLLEYRDDADLLEKFFSKEMSSIL